MVPVRDAGTVTNELTVGQVASLVGISVRTLHHWDEVALVRPSGRTHGDYRVYDAADVARINRVLVYRELGMSLAEIGRVLDDPEVDEREQLLRQRTLLTTRIARLQEMVSAVDQMVEGHDMGQQLSPQEQAEIFGTDWKPEYAEEAEQRWGDTPQWEQSQARASSMTREQWEQVKADVDALEADLAAAKRSGVDPVSNEAAELVERHRRSIDRFYDCSTSMQVCLTRMYLEDARFTEHYEQLAPGLTAWLADAVAATARAQGIDPETATWQ